MLTGNISSFYIARLIRTSLAVSAMQYGRVRSRAWFEYRQTGRHHG
nr:MAG TPA: hypothetical protein [Inoviridae sp.]